MQGKWRFTEQISGSNSNVSNTENAISISSITCVRTQMKDLFCEMNRERKKLMAFGKKSFPGEIPCDYEKRYMDFVASSYRKKQQFGHSAKKDEKAIYRDTYYIFVGAKSVSSNLKTELLQ